MSKMLRLVRYAPLYLMLALVSPLAYGQQQGAYTQYIFNTLAINPGYAGYQGGGTAIDMRLLARQQWVGIDGAPSTQTLSLSAPIPNKKMGVGLQLTHDKVGTTREVTAGFIYAYHLQLSKRTFSGKFFTKDSYLSMGIQTEVGYFGNELSQTQLSSPDPAFYANNVRTALFNVGFGIFYYSDRFYAGISVPRVLENSKSRGTPQARHIFFTTGALFDLSPSLTLKPSILLRAVAGAPLVADINLNLQIKKLLWVGVSWRSFASFNIMAQYQISKRILVGYSYDIVTTDIRKISNHTHEVLVNYRLPLGTAKILNPRRF